MHTHVCAIQNPPTHASQCVIFLCCSSVSQSERTARDGVVYAMGVCVCVGLCDEVCCWRSRCAIFPHTCVHIVFNIFVLFDVRHAVGVARAFCRARPDVCSSDWARIVMRLCVVLCGAD